MTAIDRRALVLDYHGLAVRLAARRPRDRVLVQYLRPKHGDPMPSWAEVYPHQLRAPGMTMAHLKSLIVVLPLARFAGDDDGQLIEGKGLEAKKVEEAPRPARLPYVDND